MTNIQVALIVFGGIASLALDLLVIAARAALRHSSWARLIHIQDENGLDTSGRTLAMLEKMPRPYASLHLAQSFLRFLLIGFVYIGIRAYQHIDRIFTVLGALFVIGLVIAWLEWMVERRVLRDPEHWIFRYAGFVRYLTLFLFPFVSLSLFLSQEIGQSKVKPSTVTEDALKTLVDVGQKDGVLEKGERRMIRSIFQLDDTLAREIMVPRIDVKALEIGASLPETVDIFLSSGFSRMPVFDETIDNILGLLYAKDLLELWQEKNKDDDFWPQLLREPFFVPEAKKVDELLVEMQKRRVHMAIVVDEYGGVAGVVTLEDIIEEIFGEIQDEYDDEEELPYTVLENGDYLFRGRIDLDDFNEVMECSLPNDEADTLSGFIYTRLGHVPTVGENVQEDGLLLTVEQVSKRRIRKVRAQHVPPKENDYDE